ncbi:hypothetical protein ACTXT7_015328 [Hymenolepis weldensis]
MSLFNAKVRCLSISRRPEENWDTLVYRLTSREDADVQLDLKRIGKWSTNNPKIQQLFNLPKLIKLQMGKFIHSLVFHLLAGFATNGTSPNSVYSSSSNSIVFVSLMSSFRFFSTEYLRSMRFCEYFGRFFCSMCHSNTLMALPGALVQTWSGAMYPVSKFARDLLTPLHNLPLLHSADFGPNLRRKPPWTLLDAIQLRKQALAIVPFLKLCHDSKCSLLIKK